MDPALATLARAGGYELTFLLAIEAVAAHALALVFLYDWLGRRGRRERRLEGVRFHFVLFFSPREGFVGLAL